MLVYGCLFRCIEPILSIAASIGEKTPFLTTGSREQVRLAKQRFKHGHSDLLTLHNVFDEFSKSGDKAVANAVRSGSLSRGSGGNAHESVRKRAQRDFCSKNQLFVHVLHSIERARVDLASQLISSGFLPKAYTSRAPATGTNSNVNKVRIL